MMPTRIFGTQACYPRASLILVAVFFGDIVLFDLAGANLGFIRVRSVLDAVHNFGLERLPFFQQLLHTFGIHVGTGGNSLHVPGLPTGTRSQTGLFVGDEFDGVGTAAGLAMRWFGLGLSGG